MSDITPPRVFISYSHDSDEHCQRVLDLAQELRRNGIEAIIDRFTPHPKEGWPRWMQRQIEESNFVLAICTATYKQRFDGRDEQGKGLGVNWEGYLTAQLIYDDRMLNEKVIPILFDGSIDDDVPFVLRGVTRYNLPGSQDALLRRFTDQPEVVPEPLGQQPHLPPRFTPLEDAPVQSVGATIYDDHYGGDFATKASTSSMLDIMGRVLETKYGDTSNQYTPLEARKDLRLCPWEPRFIIRNPVKRHSGDKTEQITVDYVESVCSTQRLVVLGEPGCGKSTGLHVAAHKMATLWLSGLGNRVPVIVNLNRYADSDNQHPRDTLIEMVRDECNRALRSNKRSVDESTVNAYLQAGRLCVFFDGLNEVPASLRTKCIQSLIDFCDEFARCFVTITSRKYMYNGELPFPAMEVIELGREEIVGFVEKYANDSGVTAQSILRVVDKTRWHLFQNPLALHMMVRVFQEINMIPENRALLIENYVEIVLGNYIANKSRTGEFGVSKEEIKKTLSSISELMSTRGLCLPSDEVEQHIREQSHSPEITNAILEVALESGLLVKEGGAIRFWHHSIQEYFFVLAFYFHWKQYMGKKRASRKYIRAMLKRPEKWETISMTTGLMNEEEIEVFLKECVAKDEYLTAMALNHCGDFNSALVAHRNIIHKSKIVSLFSYWMGNILEWEFVKQVIFLLLIAKQVIRIGGIAFLEPSGVSLPIIGNLLGPYVTEDVLQFGMIFALIVVLRRVSDYLVFIRFNTIIRALQHIGSPEARSELMRVFRKFSESTRIDLHYLTVVRRVVVSNICTQDELMDGLKHDEEKLYCLTELSNIAERTALPFVCNLIRVERDKYVLEAAIDCVASIADRYPQCKEDELYRRALRYAILNQRLSLKSRIKAYSYFVEASGTAADISYPTLSRPLRIKNALLSPNLTTYYLMTAVITFVLIQTDAFAIFFSIFSTIEIGTLSSSAFIRIVILNVCLFLIIYLTRKVDLNLQGKVRSKADRKWLLLGESTSGRSRKVPVGNIKTRTSEIEHSTANSTWIGSCVAGVITRTVSHGLRQGYAVDYLHEKRVSLRLMLTSSEAKSQTNALYRVLLNMTTIVFVFAVFLIISESQHIVEVGAVYLCLNIVEFIVWLSVNPSVSVFVSQVGQRAEVEGEIQLGTRRFPVSKAKEAAGIMTAVVADIAGNFESSDHSLCNHTGETGKYCTKCGESLNENLRSDCKHESQTGNFCMECGVKLQTHSVTNHLDKD